MQSRKLPSRCLVVARQPTEANQLKTIWRQKPVRTTWPCDPPPSNVRRPRSATTSTRQRPRLVPASLTRPHHDQRAIGPPLHPGTLPNGTGMLLTRVATPATHDGMPALMSGSGQAESVRVSCPTRLEHPSISSNTSTCCWNAAGCAMMLQPGQRRDSPLRAVAGATEPRRRAINEQQASAHHLTRDSAQRGPTTSRTRRFGRKNLDRL